ncbi:MAG: flavin reductase family protein [Spongiibacteraceae bacterium]|nr:flavin reductase family protein [Spongiibacteraceae bacterium]
MTTSVDVINWSASDDYRRSFGCFPSGVTVVTTVTTDGKPVGLTINSFTSVSLSPPMILWCLKENSKLRDVFRHCSHFAVHVLGHDQQEISRRFCAPVEDRFAGLTWHRGTGDVPLLDGCSAVIECRRGEVVTWGDHDVINGVVERHGYCDKEPLAFLAGSYGAFRRFPEVA